jgi:IS30 family transposase
MCSVTGTSPGPRYVIGSAAATWQRAVAILRRLSPTAIANFAQLNRPQPGNAGELNIVADRLNYRPRKIVDFMRPKEVFA